MLGHIKHGGEDRVSSGWEDDWSAGQCGKLSDKGKARIGVTASGVKSKRIGQSYSHDKRGLHEISKFCFLLSIW